MVIDIRNRYRTEQTMNMVMDIVTITDTVTVWSKQ